MTSGALTEWVLYRLARRANRRRLRGRDDPGVTALAREALLPHPERAAARERRAKAAMRRERDNPETPERRPGAVDAERRRDAYGERVQDWI